MPASTVALRLATNLASALVTFVHSAIIAAALASPNACHRPL
jgi:hypothetical protein